MPVYVEQITSEASLDPADQLVLPAVVKVQDETGGAWLFYDGPVGPGFAWLPAGEGVGLNGQNIGMQLLHWTQALFDGFTDTAKHSYFVIYNDKP